MRCRVTPTLEIAGRLIGSGLPTYIVAEISANHGQRIEDAIRLVQAAKQAGADAVKLQTYTPDTITIDSDAEWFQIKGTAWDGRNLYRLYEEAYTPWEWHPSLKALATDLGLDFFSTPFDPSAVDFLEQLGVPAFKIASCELVDLPLIKRVARSGLPMILSTGMATLGEIEEALQVARSAGLSQIALLKCTAAYPAPADEMNLRTIPHLAEAFHVPVGLSDHSLGIVTPVAAVALGACIVEKHITLSRDFPGPDSAFSLEPLEFKAMVEAVRLAEQTLGEVRYSPTESEMASRIYRRSLFVVRTMQAGEAFTVDNIRSIRPGHGLPTKHIEEILGRHAARAIEAGTPLSWDLIA